MLTYQVPFSALIAFGALLARNSDHASAAGAELAFGVFFAVSFAVRGVLAFVSPRQTTSTLLAVSVVATIAGVALLAAASDLALLLVAMAVLGIPHGATFPLASGILAERTPRHHLAAANGRLMASANTISIVVPLLSGWLATRVGYPHMFLTIEVPVVAMGAVLMGQLRSRSSPLRDQKPSLADLKLG
jgi:MFS family permease